jgi:hypothetical protein
MRFNQFLTISTGIPHDLEVDHDKQLFDQMVDFITGLNPEQLTEEQKGRIVNIISNFKLSTVEGYNKIDDYYTMNKDRLGNIYR